MTIKELYKSALEAERETGIPALFVVAQAILESGWRITSIKVKEKESNNIYGIKYSPGDPKCPHCREWGYIEALTTEFKDGVEYQKTLKFQRYPTLKDCIKHHTKMLTENIIGSKGKYTYKQCLEHYKKDKNLKKYVQCVALSYATDPYYAKKIMNIIDSIKKEVANMDEFDKKQKKEVYKNKYEREKEESKTLMKKLGIINNFGQAVTDERLAVILARTIKCLKKS